MMFDSKKRAYDRSEFDPKHQVNWFVYRNKKIRDKMKDMWGKGPENPHAMFKATRNQKLVKEINVLFRNMEKHGPEMASYRKYTPDKINDLHHCHLSGDYIVMWEADKDKHYINIVYIGTHENLSFKRKHTKSEAMKKIEAEAKHNKFFKKPKPTPKTTKMKTK